jgi:hypothetical protein
MKLYSAAKRLSPTLRQLLLTCVALRESDGDDVRLAVPLRLALLDSELEGVSVCMAQVGKTGKRTTALTPLLFCTLTTTHCVSFLPVFCAVRNFYAARLPRCRDTV